MSTPTPNDNLLAAYGAVGDLLKQTAEKKTLLQGYRQTKQEYSDLVDVTKAELDSLTAQLRAASVNLRDVLNAQLPPS